MIKINLLVLTLTLFCNHLSFGKIINSQFPYTDDSLKIIEKVYLHTDRDSYYPGDEIWFKAYLVDASDRFLSGHSFNLHVEIISPASIIIDSRIVKLVNGMGNGDFVLSENLKSGMYRIRAYTNYMRNFSDHLYFTKEITIINPSGAIKSFSDSINYTSNKLEISFFPEGGSLVDNVPSLVAFKAVDAPGNGCNVTGVVYSSAGETVTEFESTHSGMGTFTLNPVPGVNYYATVKNSFGDVVKSDIPKSFSTGIVLNISKNQNKELSIIFKTNNQTLPLILDQDLSLTISARSIAYKTYSFRMKSLNSFFNLPAGDLPDGIVMLTLSGLNKIPLCERLAFIQNDDDVRVKVETDKIKYNKRDSVSLKISLIVNSRIPQDAFLSLSATDNIFRNNYTKFPSTISSWFLLESDIRGRVEEPSYYFDPSNTNRLNDLNLLLLTQGWRDFEWKYNKMNFPPEYGFTISGRVRKKFADVPLKNSRVNIGIFKSGNNIIRTVPADTSGRFFLEGIDLTGDAKLIISAISEKDQLQGLLLLDSLKYASAQVEDKIAEKEASRKDNLHTIDDQIINDNQIINENLHSFIQYSEVKNFMQKQYKLSDTIRPGEVNIVAKRSYAPESAISRGRRYLKATPEYSLTVTPQLQIHNSLLQAIRAGIPRTTPRPGFFMNPIYLLDGTKVSVEEVESLPISYIERIDVLYHAADYAVFGAGCDGVISIITREGGPLITTSQVFHSVNLKFSGYNEPRIFYSPKHHTTLESDYKPDLRTTLFWEPNIKVENNKEIFLNYFNADNKSTIEIIAEGITTNGIPVTGKVEYEVK